MIAGEDRRFRALDAEDLTRIFEPHERELGREWLARQAEGELYVAVAEASGVPVGRRCLNFTWRSDVGAAYCFGFLVKPDWRSRGIGTQLDRHCETVARGRGFKALQCAIARDNPRGLAWHHRIGYRTIDQRIVRWQEQGTDCELDAWIVERRWKRHYPLLARIKRRVARLVGRPA